MCSSWAACINKARSLPRQWKCSATRVLVSGSQSRRVTTPRRLAAESSSVNFERHVIVFILTVSCACVGQALTPGPGAPGFEANHDVVRSSQTALDALSLVPRHRAQYDIVLKLSLITLAWPSSQANDTRFALVGAADSYLYTVPRPSCFHPRVRLLYDPQEDQLVDNRCSELSQCSTQMIMSQAEKLILSLNGRAKDGSNSATLKVRRLNSWVLNRF